MQNLQAGFRQDCRRVAAVTVLQSAAAWLLAALNGGRANHTTAISARKLQPHSQKRSLVASMYACWTIERSSVANAESPCIGVKGLKAVMLSVSRDWCSASRRSHQVVVSEVAKLPARVRRVFASPDALATRLGGSPERTIDISGAKNSATPSPCAKRDQASVEKLTCVLKPAYQKDATP